MKWILLALVMTLFSCSEFTGGVYSTVNLAMVDKDRVIFVQDKDYIDGIIKECTTLLIIATKDVTGEVLSVVSDEGFKMLEEVTKEKSTSERSD